MTRNTHIICAYKCTRIHTCIQTRIHMHKGLIRKTDTGLHVQEVDPMQYAYTEEVEDRLHPPPLPGPKAKRPQRLMPTFTRKCGKSASNRWYIIITPTSEQSIVLPQHCWSVIAQIAAIKSCIVLPWSKCYTLSRTHCIFPLDYLPILCSCD